jgi:flagellar hook-associated protein 3 FlgL
MVTFGSPFGGALSTRVSSALSSNIILSNLNRAQRTLLRIQEELSSGYRINRPSDDPAGAARVMDYTLGLQRNASHLRNLDHVTGRLERSDASMSAVGDLLTQAKTILLDQRQAPADAASRAQAASEIDALIQSALREANARVENRHLFGGGRTTEAPFVAVGGEIAFLGDLDALDADVADGFRVRSNVGGDAFGAFSSQVQGLDPASFLPIDLDPAVTGATALSDLHGGRGVTLGSIEVTGGLGSATIDLRAARTMGDVLDLLNGQAAVTGVTASLNPAANGLRLTSGGPITVADVLNGTTAADLGIIVSAAASPFDGGDLDPRLAKNAHLDDLFGAGGIDGGGLVLTNATATQTHTATISGAATQGTATVEQFLNAINASGAYVHARISDDGRRIELVSRLSGGRLKVAENLGGSTAQDLGLRSTLERSRLSDLNGGKGAGSGQGADLRITKMDGTQILIDVDGAATVRELLNTIAADPDLTVTVTGADQIQITDASAGAGTLLIEDVSPNGAASALGIAGSVTGAGPQTLTGSAVDFAGVEVEGAFTALIRLRDALLADDGAAMDAANAKIDAAQDLLLDARADSGARAAGLEVLRGRLEEESVFLEGLRSGTRDVDLAEAATRFQIQQTMLEASLATAARILDTHLLKFI